MRFAHRGRLALVPLLFAFGACDPFARHPTEAVTPTATGGMELVFRTEPGGLYRFHPVATDGARIYAGTEDNTLIALDMSSGATAWRVQGGEDDPIGAATYDDGRVYTASRVARGWDAASGAKRWEVALGSSARDHHGYAADGMYYIGTDTSVFALEGATGAIRWRVSIGREWMYDGRVRSIAGDDELLYVCAGEPLAANAYRIRGHIIAIERSTGDIRWRHVMAYETNYNFCMGPPTIAGDLIVVGDAGGNNFVAVSRETGAFRWRHAGDSQWVGPYAAPVAFGDTLYAASNDKRIMALERATGRAIWTSELGGSAWHATRCGRVVLATNLSLHVLNPRTGAVVARPMQQQFAGDDIVTSPILVRNGFAYAMGNGRFYKWRCPT